MKYFIDALAKYAVFRGRANRTQYWMFVLFSWIITTLVTWLTGGKAEDGGISLLASLTTLFFVLPYLSITVRRLHDTDRSGWWWWLNCVPLIGQIWLFVLMLLPGTPWQNRYGKAPW